MNFATVSRSLGLLALLALAGAGVLLLMLAIPGGRARLRRDFGGEPRGLLALATFIAAFATGGSLYLSEIVGFTPCLLCWYQRIAMYPLVIVLGVGAMVSDRAVWRYGLPLSVVGFGIAIYHIVIQFRPALDAGMCAEGVSCTARYIAVFGFVSIPFMAGSAFVLIAALLLVLRLGADESVDSVEEAF